MNLIREYVDATKLVAHQIDTYNYFVVRGMQAIVNREPKIRWNDSPAFAELSQKLQSLTSDLKLLSSTTAAEDDDDDESEENQPDVDVNGDVPRLLSEIADVERELRLGEKIMSIDDVYLDRPRMTMSNSRTELMFPNDARDKGMTYEGTLYANVTLSSTRDDRATVYARVPIGKLPVMLRSCVCNLDATMTYDKKECPSDCGGYFIIRGHEKVLRGQLRPAYNRAYVYESKREEKWTHYVEMRSGNPQGVSVLIQGKIDERLAIVFSLPYIKTLVPAGMVFRAIGIDDFDVVWRRYVRGSRAGAAPDDKAYAVISEQFEMCATREEAIDYIAKRVKVPERDPVKVKAYIENILRNEIFYHIGNATVDSCARHIGFMIKQLLDVVVRRLRPVDDKCNLSNKRFDSTHALLEFLFQGLFKQFTRQIQAQLSTKKNLDPIQCMRANNSITHAVMTCFGSGTWIVQKSATGYVRVGVSEPLSVQNTPARLSNKRRFTCAGGTKGRSASARLIHPSQFGFVCPCETPEGETVGLVNNIALTVEVTTNVPTHEILGGIESMSAFVNERSGQEYAHTIVLNGQIVGGTDRPVDFVREFDRMRRTFAIDPRTTIYRIRDVDEIHIESDAGRLVRPLFAIDAASTIAKRFVTRPQSWRSGVDDGVIVFRSPSEIERCVVAMHEADLASNRCDYMEISPAGVMFGAIAAVIPLQNHNQSPRNAYESNMMKQAIGFPMTSINYRMDTVMHAIDYGQKQIARSELVSVLKYDELVVGAMPIVAVMTFSGFNQEDSVVLNASSVQRGLFCSHTYRTIVEEERKRGSTDYETICAPKYEHRRREYDYSYIGESGVINARKFSSVWLKQGTVIVGKTRTSASAPSSGGGAGGQRTTDASVVIKSGEEGYVDRVIDTTTTDGARVIKVRVRIPMIPEIGDKFASSTAQKGTCGMMYRQEDMPFDAQGMTPDLIINPHAMPSRMTINMLLEMFQNLYACKKGAYPDATSFAHDDMETEIRGLFGELAANDPQFGYSTTMYSGATGERFPARVFIGPAFYQRLNHLVANKMHARPSVGPVDPSTHQPVGGRRKEGGLKMGEMERDALIAHGVGNVINSAFFTNSDGYVIQLCEKCGSFADAPDYCRECGSGEWIARKNLPFASKHLFQQLMAMGVKLCVR